MTGDRGPDAGAYLPGSHPAKHNKYRQMLIVLERTAPQEGFSHHGPSPLPVSFVRWKAGQRQLLSGTLLPPLLLSASTCRAAAVLLIGLT